MGAFDERPRLTQIQAAVLRAAHTASGRIGTVETVPERLFEAIVRHFFREQRVLGAIKQLRRANYLSRAPNGTLNLHVPSYAWSATLPGDDPEPLSDTELAAIIVRTGYVATTVSEQRTPLAEAAVDAPRTTGLKKMKGSVRRFALLANHHLAEAWYGSSLPSPLSRAVVVADHTCEDALLALRSKLTVERLMESFPSPTGRHECQWNVTPFGVAYYERVDVEPTLSLDRIESYATALGYAPVLLGDRPGR